MTYKSAYEGKVLSKNFDFKPNPQGFNFKNFEGYSFISNNIEEKFDEFSYRPDYSYLVSKYDYVIIERNNIPEKERQIDDLAYLLRISDKSDARVRMFSNIIANRSNNMGGYREESVKLFTIEQNKITRYFFDFIEIHKNDFFKIVELHPNLNDIKKILLHSEMNEEIKSKDGNHDGKKVKI